MADQRKRAAVSEERVYGNSVSGVEKVSLAVFSLLPYPLMED